jgi:uroporphyrinogen-III synthase
MAGRPFILVARSKEDAAADCAALASFGIEAVGVPVLCARQLADDSPLPPGCQAVLYTSRRAVRPHHASSGLPAFCVGPGSAAAAQQAGFRQTHAGNAGAEALAELVRARLAAQDGPLFWPHGEQTAFDITRPLAAAGFATQEAIIYRMQRAAKLPDQLDRLLQSGRPAALLVASAGQLRGFAELLKEAGLWHCAKGLVLLAGSQRIAAAVPSGWQDIRLADNKSRAGLLALARDWAERQDPAEPQD